MGSQRQDRGGEARKDESPGGRSRGAAMQRRAESGRWTTAEVSSGSVLWNWTGSVLRQPDTNSRYTPPGLGGRMDLSKQEIRHEKHKQHAKIGVRELSRVFLYLFIY
ncbi:predicted protein [Histoplasma capsulatum G186AR]|uniref:Uncharacterized protein n=1 Tax=Ajellomyces capsulatus (strain G186AR / H82 / ATCC MYA-2454 / RMSCC 2432) TaxID=447093 RepID=C0NIG2_AJECG|nr:uncharacterized protein HCBG_02219 [Histoplasma capsulatum G186AR]EEH08682.1 predicted protein [Histoplasma capsulatum G186AR]